jgi:tol-pal system protein YbgF
MNISAPSCAGGRTSVAVILTMLAATAMPLAALAQTDGGINQRVERLERALDNKGLLDLVRQIELLNEQVRQLRGEVENQIFALEQQRKSQRDSYLDIDRRVGLLEQGGIISLPPNVAATSAGVNPLQDPPLPTLTTPGDTAIAGRPSDQSIAVAVEAWPSAPSLSPSAAIMDDNRVAPEPIVAAAIPSVDVGAIAPDAGPAVVVVDAPSPSIQPLTPTIDSAASEAAYREAFAMLKAGQYEQSIAAFNAYLQQYPASQYADNAQYWVGEAYYVMRQFEPAIEQYQRLVQNHPDSKKRSHAMLKIAYSYYELGLTEQAASVLTDLKSRFPASAAARLADERLQRIRAEAP